MNEIIIDNQVLREVWDGIFDAPVRCWECEVELSPKNAGVISKKYGCYCSSFPCLMTFYTLRNIDAIPGVTPKKSTKHVEKSQKTFIQTGIDETIPEREVKPYARRRTT